jgi:hypothetical protein
VLVIAGSAVTAISTAAAALPAKHHLGGGGPIVVQDDPGGGIPSGFIALFVIFAIIAVGTGIWRFSVTRKAAQDAGLSPDKATAVAMFGGGNALDASLLASAIKHRDAESARATPTASGPSVDQRLAQLQGLRERGLITPEEYHERRKEIIDSI